MGLQHCSHACHWTLSPVPQSWRWNLIPYFQLLFLKWPLLYQNSIFIYCFLHLSYMFSPVTWLSWPGGLYESWIACPRHNNNNSIQLFIYLRAELKSQWPITESARIQTTAIRQHRTKQTKNNNKTKKNGSAQAL
jgi:hypothetical protein